MFLKTNISTLYIEKDMTCLYRKRLLLVITTWIKTFYSEPNSIHIISVKKECIRKQQSPSLALFNSRCRREKRVRLRLAKSLTYSSLKVIRKKG